MHGSVIDYVDGVINAYDLKGKNVLEVGSLNENGSVRNLFEAKDYIGVDMRDGPGVDRVVNAHYLTAYFALSAFEVVVCTEMLEHDEAFWVSIAEMGLVLRRGGFLILTMRGNGFPHHAYPNDYWRFMPDSANSLLALAYCEKIDVANDPQDPGLFVVGRKRAMFPT